MKQFSHGSESRCRDSDVLTIKRSQNFRITNYLDEFIKEFEHVEYSIEQSLDETLLKSFIHEDLPGKELSFNKKLFIDDIAHLSTLFFNLCERKKIKITLELVPDGMCKVFHVDNIKQRLLCTYRGLGTEWLTDNNTNRDGLGSGDNFKIVKDFKLINKAEAFDVLILTGKKGSHTSGGAVHRSPDLKSNDKIRVLLKIDEC